MRNSFTIMEAILRLVAHDRFMFRHDLAALHRSVREFPRSAKTPSPRTIEMVSRSLDIACACYPKQAFCLQRSTVLVKMLRRRGVAAHLVIGAQKLPFVAHAWVEANGKIINDRLATAETFLILEIC